MGKTAELIESAEVCLACSGSVSLELLYHLKPTVIHYKVGRLAFFVQRFFRKVRYITLVNLLASDNPYCAAGELYDADGDDVPFPEYLTWQDRSQTMADQLVAWLTDSSAQQCCVEQLRQLKAEFAVPGASDRAADYSARSVAAACPPTGPPSFSRCRERPSVLSRLGFRVETTARRQCDASRLVTLPHRQSQWHARFCLDGALGLCHS